MDERDLTLSRLAARQHWVVRRQDAFNLGLTSRQIDGRVRAGVLVSVHRGVYRFGAAPRTHQQRLMAACLATGGVVSHRAAAQLLDLRGVNAAPVEITVRPGVNNRLNGVVVHRASLGRVDLARIGSLPSTRPALSLLGLAAMAPRLLEPAVEDALFRGLVTVRGLRSVLDRWGGRGHDGTAALRRLLDARDPALAPTESGLEDEAFAVLRRFGLPEPVRQHPVTRPGLLRPYRLDMAYPYALVDIEVDGLRWHLGTREAERDRERDNYLMSLGWVVLRFTPFHVRRQPARLAEQVRTVLAARAAA